MGDLTTNKRAQATLRLRCGVCRAPAPDHFHFGGHCCYSCRAFFRRTTQRVTLKGLKRCKTGLKNCELSPTTKSCINCRYNKCLSIGMSPSLMQGDRMKQRKTEESEIVSEPIDVDKVTSEVLTQPDDPPSPPLRVSVIKRKDREEIGEPLSHQGSLSLGEGTLMNDSEINEKIPQPTFGPSLAPLFNNSSASDQEKLSDIFYEAHQLIQQTSLYDVIHKLSENIPQLEDNLKQEIKTECHDSEEHQSYQGVSIINQPQMFLTGEEKCLLDSLLTKHSFACSNCCPVSLYVARVEKYLGTLSPEEMYSVFTTSRRAQNFFHFTVMSSLPGFQELTSRTQNNLMRQNTGMCYSLNSAYYFFGHDASTAIGQEEQTGLMTGLGEYIRQYAPYASGMGCAEYDDYYKPPWATSPHMEQRHRQLSAQIGTAVKELGVLSYIILYGLLFYSVSDVNLRKWETPHSDYLLITRMRYFFDTIFGRYLKNRLSWNELSFNLWNQRYIASQVTEVTRILTEENLQLDDFSNSQTIEAISLNKFS